MMSLMVTTKTSPMANITKCPECGCPINGESVCPECGYRFDSDNSVDAIPTNTSDLKTNPLTKGYYRWWSLTQPWYVGNSHSVNSQHRYDALNEGLLLFNLVWRISLWWMLFGIIAIACFCTLILIPLGLWIIFSLFPWAVARYWAIIHILWRRLNQRYWISMRTGIKTNHLETL